MFFNILEISVQLTALDSFFGGASLIHPSFVDVKDAENAGAPILALPSQNEPDMVKDFKLSMLWYQQTKRYLTFYKSMYT